MATQSVLVCQTFSSGSCSSQVWVDAYVVTPDQEAQLNLLSSGGFDSDTFATFFEGTLALFAVGFTVGIIISQIRKVRRS